MGATEGGQGRQHSPQAVGTTPRPEEAELLGLVSVCTCEYETETEKELDPLLDGTRRYVGAPADRFTFGAHDFRGGSFETTLEETVTSQKANGSVVSDGAMHSVAVVVDTANKTLTFYTDAIVQDTIKLTRPITDCSGIGLEVGDAGIPKLGEITFFARALTVVEMKEIMYTGFTLQAVSTGKLPFVPEQTPFDTMAATQSQVRGNPFAQSAWKTLPPSIYAKN
jgi:hypothetical protein